MQSKQSKSSKRPSNYKASPIEFEAQISLHRQTLPKISPSKGPWNNISPGAYFRNYTVLQYCKIQKINPWVYIFQTAFEGLVTGGKISFQNRMGFKLVNGSWAITNKCKQNLTKLRYWWRDQYGFRKLCYTFNKLLVFKTVFLPDHRCIGVLPHFFGKCRTILSPRGPNLLQNVRKHTYTYVHFLIRHLWSKKVRDIYSNSDLVLTLS